MSHPPPEPKYVFRDGMSPVSCVDFGRGDTLFAGTQDGWIHVWDLTINRRKISFQAGNSVILSVKCLSDRIVTQVKGEGVSFWNYQNSFELLNQVKCSYVGFCKVEVHCSETFKYIFVPEDNAEISVRDFNSCASVGMLAEPSVKLGEVMVIKCITYLFQKLLLVGYESGDIFLWDFLKCMRVSQFKIGNVPMAIDFDCDQGKVVCGTESDTVYILLIDSNYSIKNVKSLLLTNPGVSALTIRHDKKILVLGCWDGNVRVFSWKTGRILAVLSEHAETVNDLCYSSSPISSWNSIILAVASKDKSISLWSFY